MVIPYCAVQEPHSIAQCLEVLRNRQQDCIVLLESTDFYNWEDIEDFDFDEVSTAYDEQYNVFVQQLTTHLGQPSFVGNWQNIEQYPDWAYGDQIAIWQLEQDSFWIYNWWQDKELPIKIVLQRVL
jgi:hypothetical protein